MNANGPPPPAQVPPPAAVLPAAAPDPEAQAELLSELLQHVNIVRSVNKSAYTANAPLGTQLRTVHKAAQLFVGRLATDAIQSALQTALDLEGSTTAEVALSPEEEERLNPKRRKTTGPEHSQSASAARIVPRRLPPHPSSGPDTITLDNLAGYLRQHRNDFGPRFHVQIWLPEKLSTPHLPNPVTLKLYIPEVLVVYLELFSEQSGVSVAARKVVAFGPREKRLPHMQSEYSIFRFLSQVLTKVISDNPSATVLQLMDLISSYDKLYSEICVACKKHMSREGHLPPVERLWEPQPLQTKTPTSTIRPSVDGVRQPGRWIARHVGCQ